MPPPNRRYRRPVQAKRVPARETPVAEMGLPLRIVNALEQEGVIWVEGLLKLNREQLLRIKNFGDKTLVEIAAAVERLKLPVPHDWTHKPRPIPKPRPPSGRPRGMFDTF